MATAPQPVTDPAAALQRFCIVVPVGAYHPMLRDSFASLRAQTVPLEVALMDASGDPRVAEVADTFDGLFTHRHHGPDDGQTDAIMSGWARLDGDILGWLNADDMLLPDALERAALAFRRNPEAGVVYGESQIVSEDGAFSGFHWNVGPPGDTLLTNCNISQPSCFFRREAYDDAGGLDPTLHYTMDWDLWVRLYRSGARFHCIDEVLSSVLWCKDTKTGGFGRSRREELARIIAKHPSPLERLRSHIGFSKHHIMEYIAPPGLSRRIRRQRGAKAPGKYGVRLGGALDETALIPLFHYDDTPRCRVDLDLTGDVDAVSAKVDGVPLTPSRTSGRGRCFQLPAPVDAGARATLELTVIPGARVYLERLAFEAAPEG